MMNIDEESAELNDEKLRKDVDKYLNEINEERKKLDAQITKWEKAIIQAGFEIAKIHYKRKNQKNKIIDEWGKERWYKWDSH